MYTDTAHQEQFWHFDEKSRKKMEYILGQKATETTDFLRKIYGISRESVLKYFQIKSCTGTSPKTGCGCT